MPAGIDQAVVVVDRRIKVLLDIHVLAVPFTVAAAYGRSWPHPLIAILLALVHSDACLLGIWGGLGKSHPRVCLSWIAIGLTCLTCAVAVTERAGMVDLLVTGFMIALPAIIVILVLRQVRHSRRLELIRSPQPIAVASSLQFSLRRLLAATAIIALTLSMREGLMAFDYRSTIWLYMAVFLAIHVPCVAFAGLAMLWSVLGVAEPSRALPMAVPAAFFVGTLPAFYLSKGPDLREYGFQAIVAGLQLFFTAATLLVFRACGWRLRKEPDHDMAKTPDNSFETAITQEALPQTPDGTPLR